MADRQPVDHLAEIDTLLRAELSVEPSHEFLPRVRERIRTEPTPSRWLSPWITAPLAAAAVVIVAVAFTLRPETPSPVDPSTRFVRSGQADREARTASSEPRTASTSSTRFARSAQAKRTAKSEERRANRETRTASSGVLIDPRQREALVSFVRLANQGALTEESFKLTTQPPAVIAEQVKVIAVDPLAVSPIAPGGVLPSELERK